MMSRKATLKQIEQLQESRDMDAALVLLDELVAELDTVTELASILGVDFDTLDEFMRELPHWVYHGLAKAYEKRLTTIPVREAKLMAVEDCLDIATEMLVHSKACQDLMDEKKECPAV